MNSYQIVFFIFILIPPIVSIAIEKLSDRVNGVIWTKWSDSILPLYLLEILIVLLIKLYLLLGEA